MKTNKLLFVSCILAIMCISCEKGPEGGNETKEDLPVVATLEASSVLSSSITAGGNVTGEGGSPVTEKGVCFSTSPKATVETGKLEGGSGKGAFEVTITNLKPGTTYYYAAYATNASGTAYGVEMSATTPNARLAVVTTFDVSEAIGSSAMCGGKITDDGNSAITARGVCWSRNENPTVEDSKTEDGTGKGDFMSSITGLTAGDTYYVRAYATNDAGTAYGEQKSFATIDAQVPTVRSYEVTDKTATSAMCGGEVISDGGTSVTSRGVVWATHKEPTISDNKAESTSNENEFTAEITGIVEGKVYYARAFATNAIGTSYGEERLFAAFYLDNGETMLKVKGGTFTVGKNAIHSEGGNNCWECTLPDYYIAKTEVTQGLWAEIMGTAYLRDQLTDAQKPDGYICYPVGADDYNPQPYINWFDAIIFCNKLSIARGVEPVYSVNGETNPDNWTKTGEWEKGVICDPAKNGFRLPFLPEWEFAAGGGEEPLQTYPGTDDFNELKYYGQIEGALNGGATEGLFTVATKLPNKLGLYDMVGNATEWVWELRFEYPSDAKTYYDNRITWNYGDRKAVKKGGSIWNWGQFAYYTTSNCVDPIDDHNWPCGMRLARTCTE